MESLHGFLTAHWDHEPPGGAHPRLAGTLAPPRRPRFMERVLPGCRGRRLGRREVLFALAKALEELVAFAAAAHKDVLVLQHGLDNAENRLGAKVVGAVEAIHG